MPEDVTSGPAAGTGPAGAANGRASAGDGAASAGDGAASAGDGPASAGARRSDLAGGPAPHLSVKIGIDTEELTGRTFPYQFDRSLVDDVDLVEATPGPDINWLEDIHLMYEDGVPAVFDRYTNAFLKIHFEIPPGREDEFARKVLITHLREGNSYGLWLKRRHAKFPQPELGSWRADSATVGEHWEPPVWSGDTPTTH